ncbi:G-type lectin S-receptor-like serine/threonine-protein kinase SD2-5 [Aegilops tauschii subsp. strangulata]|uniref:Receptor-like serine/threonine-protein kinase n=2 Tax=Aegilops tauschii TaxID=37682 RepID=A0A453RG42_AEGTS|nr:G-type lectin S-receptor-like serine/threonine-protein kinase SD2-5 [Aegilops tauschii subsp. strangulata]XP_020158729.1 G-type lectin S-receptor-like serine/threonine-protein kinase SD2-5 [Aegilops tauschii subsp. strangulata]
MTGWFLKIPSWKGSPFIQMNARRKCHVSSLCFIMLWVLVLPNLWITCSGSIQKYVLPPGFSGSEMEYIDNSGIFLLSNGSVFGFGFITSGLSESPSYLLAVVHLGTTTVVWTANANSPVSHSDSFEFDKDGKAYLQSAGSTVWTANISGKGASMQLLDSGNLVVLGEDSSSPLWQSFSYPTNTLLSGQSFSDGMTLVSHSTGQNMTHTLQIKSGDMMLYAGFQNPQPYWSALQDNRLIFNKNGAIYSANLSSTSWSFYDKSGSLLSQLIIAQKGDANTTLAAVLGEDGSIAFYMLQSGNDKTNLPTPIPQDSCDTPTHCKPYSICSSGTGCQCPSALGSSPNCDPGLISPCKSKEAFQLAQLDSGVGYIGTSFTSPVPKTNITGCKNTCMGNCSCIAVFFDQKTGNCFIFDQIGSLQQKGASKTNFSSFIKVSSSGSGQAGSGSDSGNHNIIIVVIIVVTLAVIGGLVYVGFFIYRRKRYPPSSQDEAGSSEDDGYLQTISGAPVRFTYRELQDATNNFSNKLGQGGFGSVYLGTLPDSSRIAVKKLEGIGQGRKEFRSEVTIIGSIHHIHLVKLRGFCAEDSHRLLAYEYMAKGSLERWIFRTKEDDPLLDWDTRFNIALGAAKGLAYLHQDCESKIIHCDIKPENFLLDDNFLVKVSDFGLAKLMSREQSHVFTTMRGTRGYLAPEWITNYAISEKSDVYSYGMVLLEIISGRKNFDPVEGSEKAHFPSFAFKKLEEGDLREILDAKLRYNDKDERLEIAIKVALWCIQEDFYQRPSMSKVVQMLECVCDVPQPPISSQIGYRLYANALKSSSEEGMSSGMSDYNSEALLSAVRLSGPR